MNTQVLLLLGLTVSGITSQVMHAQEAKLQILDLLCEYTVNPLGIGLRPHVYPKSFAPGWTDAGVICSWTGSICR